MTQNKASDKSQLEKRKGGLGRGLAALIPSGPSSSPGLGGSAADIILGGSAGERGRQRPQAPQSRGATGDPAAPTAESALGGSAVEPAAEASTSEFGASYLEIPIDRIVPNPHQPRTVFDEEALGELVHSISEFGLMQPIVVRRSGDGFELIMGERRWRAAATAGLDVIPAIIRETDDGSMLRDALLENIHRVQLNPLEEASAYQQLLEEFGVTQSELAEKLGRSRPVITNMIRLLALPVTVQRKVAAGVLSAGHARALLGLKADEATQESLATRIIAEGLSVRATEEIVLLHNRGESDGKKQARPKAPTPEVFTRAAESLADNLDTKVSVTMGKRKGKLVVEFGDREDFQRIMSLIQGR
ncbi:ParB/RepB/Spo0J family partition protein [Corynebacterium pacaense]|uniref:ParB/RepB/Spo0J family partition protein n=1 Tax=Corynebacterium pacaense TaxID=1816684 RepID=UPI0009BBB72B|nr:ParB/RepB/Spo0J family partition protein [Corynebacterium pacaense]